MRKLVLAAVVVLMAGGAQAVTLDVIGGQLMGATDVLVDGSLYDVQFLNGTCIDLYNGCDYVSDFTFQTEASANLASQALLDQVFLDGPSGNFGSEPELIYGCPMFNVITFLGCVASTPYAIGNPSTLVVTSGAAFTFDPVDPSPETYVGRWNIQSGGDYAAVGFALWTFVPEPNTALLLGLGLSGLAAKGRRRNRS